jgi:triosephosphate isomerase
MNIIKVHFMHVWKCHNEIPSNNYFLKELMFFKKRKNTTANIMLNVDLMFLPKIDNKAKISAFTTQSQHSARNSSYCNKVKK